MNKLRGIAATIIVAGFLTQAFAAVRVNDSVKRQLLNINIASQKQLQSLPGIGKKKAEAIIAYRKQHSGFKTVNELESIKGINSRLLSKIKPKVELK